MYTSVHVCRAEAPEEREKQVEFPLEKYPQVLLSINPSNRWVFQNPGAQ